MRLLCQGRACALAAILSDSRLDDSACSKVRGADKHADIDMLEAA